jgi:endonuclease/exonuclease/phosphatase family metal-dependent hydrolase
MPTFVGVIMVMIWVSVSMVRAAEPLTIATWNVGLLDRTVAALDLTGFATEIDADILVLNKVKTLDDLQELRARLGRDEDFLAISSFEQGSGDLEVGILSRFPLTEVVEFDRPPEPTQTTPPQQLLERVTLPGIADVGTGRGFLVARVPAHNLVVIGTHLKLSRGASGPPDHANAQKRELVAAAIAAHVNELREDLPHATIVVLGDFNVGVSDATKNGTNLIMDRFTGSDDKYDETHALLTDGLVDGLTMTALAQGLASTFVGADDVPDFPSTGAIDVIYVVGPDAGLFHAAQRASKRYGSDHRAVFTASGAPAPGGSLPPSVPAPPSPIVIKKVLPNPAGEDAGQETITLDNTGDALTVTGWKFRDAAGNTFALPAGTALGTGLTVIPLTNNPLPLNNTGDTIRLLNERGLQIGPAFAYTKSDVVSGEDIVH